MTLLLLKLVLTPIFIGAASLAARRWGPAIGGWIIALPLTSGPVALFLALDQGPKFAANAAEASLAGCLAITVYAVGYARGALRGRWSTALGAGLVGWLVVAVAVQPLLHWSIPILFVLVGVAIGGGVALMPQAELRPASEAPSRWDIPLRMVVATTIVVVLTGVAPILGPGPSGLLAMLPVMGTILAVFAQRAGDAADGIAIQRGILTGLFGTAAFLAVVAGAVEHLSVVATFGLALLVVFAIQGTALLATSSGWRRQAQSS